MPIFRPTPLSDPQRFPPRDLLTYAPTVVSVPAHDHAPPARPLTLHTRLYLPDTRSDPAWRAPVILIHTPYSAAYTNDRALVAAELDTGIWAGEDFVNHFLTRGYAVAVADVRGTGASSGCLELDGPNQAQDVVTLADFLADRAANPWASGKVGGVGHSYAAEALNAGAVLGALDAIVTTEAISGVYDVACFDGVPYATSALASAATYLTVSLLPLGDAAALGRAVQRPGCQFDNVAAAADTSGDMLPYYAAREFRTRAAGVRAKVLYGQSFNDLTVLPVCIDGWFDALPKPHCAVLHQISRHCPPQAPPVLAERFSRLDWHAMVTAWFDRWLLGLDTRVEDWPAVQVQDDLGRWRAAPSYAGMFKPVAYFLDGPDLLRRPAHDRASRFGETRPASWTTAPFADGAHLSGQVELDVWVELDRDDAHFVLDVAEVAPDGSRRALTINRGFRSARHREDLAPGRGAAPVPVGVPLRYRIRSLPFDAWIRRGARLAITLSGSDAAAPTPGAVVGNGFTAVVHQDARRRSQAWLPFANGGDCLQVLVGPNGELSSPDCETI